jgi:hypothetical protein
MFALMLPSLSLVACAVQSGEPTGTEEKLGQVTQEQQAGTSPEEGGMCHVPEAGSITGPIHLGTMKNGYCCGIAQCTDEEICGDNYGKYISSCAWCGAYTCLSGPFRTGSGGRLGVGTGGLAASP